MLHIGKAKAQPHRAVWWLE